MRSVGDQHIADWTTSLAAAHKAAGTIEQYRYHVSRFLDGRTPWDVTIEDMEGYIAAQAWGPATLRTFRNAARSFYGWAVARGRTDTNPAADLPTIRSPRRQPRPTPDDVFARALASATPDTRMMLIVAASTGMRRCELARLHSDDVRLVGGAWWVRIVGKGGHERDVPVSDEIAGWVRGRGGWCWPSTRRPGEPMLAASVGKRLHRALGSASAHTLRHRYASTVYRSSHDIFAVQSLLGHASVATTQVYTQSAPDIVLGAARSAWVDPAA